MSVEYYSYGGGELLAALFNAVAAFTRTASFSDMAASAALVGIVFGTLGALHSMDMSAAVRWAVTAVVVHSLMTVPRMQVVVVDRMTESPEAAGLYGLGLSPPRVVDNVPAMLVLVGHASSLIGSTLADAFESLLGVPGERSMGAGGLFVMHRALRAMMEGYPLRDKNLRTDFVSYMQNCVYFDVEIDRRYGYSDLLDGVPLDHLGNTGDRVTSVTQTDGSSLATTCAGAWGGGEGVHGSVGSTVGLRQRILDEAAHRRVLGCLETAGYLLGMNPARLDSLAATMRVPHTGAVAGCGAPQMDGALRFLNLSGKTAGEQIRENLAIELMRDYAYSVPDVDPVEIAAAKSATGRSRNATYVIMGQIARETLPVIRSALEAVSLALFPIISVLALAIPDRMAQYVRMHFTFILWLQLWPPLMAVVNELAHRSARDAMAKYSVVAGGEISYSAFDSILDEIVLHQAVSSYLLVLTPLLAYFLAKGTDFAGALIAGRFLQPSEGLAAGQSRSAALGNWSMDQISIAPDTRAGAGVFRHMDTGGNIMTTAQGGREFLELGSRMTAVAQGAQTAVLSSVSSSTLAVGESRREFAAENMVSAYARGFLSLRSELKSSSLDESHQARDLAAERRGLSVIRNVHRELSRESGISEEESARVLGTIAANLGLGVNVFGQKAGLGGSAGVSKTVMERALDSIRRRTGDSESEGLEDVRAFAAEYSRSEAFRKAATSSLSDAESLSEEFRQGRQYAEEASAYLTKSEDLSEQARMSEEGRLSVALDLLRSHPHLSRELDERVRRHFAEGGGIEGASGIVRSALEERGLFDVEIGGEMHSPGELREMAATSAGKVRDGSVAATAPPEAEADRGSDRQGGKALTDKVDFAIETARRIRREQGEAAAPEPYSTDGQVGRVLSRIGESSADRRQRRVDPVDPHE